MTTSVSVQPFVEIEDGNRSEDVDMKHENVDFQKKYFEIQEQYDRFVQNLFLSSGSSRQIRGLQSHGSLRFISKNSKAFKQYIAFEASQELPKYLQDSITENGHIMWRFDHTIVSYMFSPERARSIHVFFFGTLLRFVITYSFFGVGLVLFVLGIFKVVPEVVFYFGFALTVCVLFFPVHCVLVDLKLSLATMSCLPSFALMVFVTLYPLSLSYMMNWDYRSIPFVALNMLLFFTVISEEAMSRRIKAGTGLLTNVLLVVFHITFLVLVNLGYIPDANMNAVMLTANILGDSIVISALGVLNQSLVPAITLLCNLVYLYAAQWAGRKIKMKNITIALNYVDDPKLDDQLTMVYFKKYLVYLGLEGE